MSNCRETDPVFICFTPADTNIAPVTLLQHVVYEEGRAIGHVITTSTDMLTEIDPATHLGGGSIVLGECRTATVTSEICYVDKIDTGTRIQWDQIQTWDAGNPTLAAMIADLEAGTPVVVSNVAGEGVVVTVTPFGTGLNSITYDSGGERLDVDIDQGQSAGLQFNFDSPQCVVISGGAFDDTDTIEYASDSPIFVTERIGLAGAVPPMVSNNNTTSVTVTGIPGLDAQLASADGASAISFLYTDVDAGQAPVDGWVFGMYVGGTATYYSEKTYSDGTTEIKNSQTGQIVPAIGEWQRIDCSAVPMTVVDAAGNAILQQLVACLCPGAVTGLGTQVMLGALTAPAAPADTREVTVQNYSAATIRITTSIGDQVVGPNGAIEFGVRTDEPAPSLTAATVVAGTFGIADQLIFNYRTEV